MENANANANATVLDADDTKKVKSFFAGILCHLPSITAFAMPLDASYCRVGSGMWSGGEYACWGWENHETPLRRITTTRFELKLMCGTANPYLTLAALLAAALDGGAGTREFDYCTLLNLDMRYVTELGSGVQGRG
jgi:glutamine synthetase